MLDITGDIISSASKNLEGILECIFSVIGRNLCLHSPYFLQVFATDALIGGYSHARHEGTGRNDILLITYIYFRYNQRSAVIL